MCISLTLGARSYWSRIALVIQRPWVWRYFHAIEDIALVTNKQAGILRNGEIKLTSWRINMGDSSSKICHCCHKRSWCTAASVSASDEWCAMSVRDLHDISEKKSLERKSLGTGTAYNTVPDLYSFLTKERQCFISLHNFTDYFEVLKFQTSGFSKQVKNNSMGPILMKF